MVILNMNVILTFILCPLYVALRSIDLGFPSEFVLTEGSSESFFFFGIIGTSFGSIPISLLPLTYRQFQDKTGRTVESVFSDVVIPPAASDGEPITDKTMIFSCSVVD